MNKNLNEQDLEDVLSIYWTMLQTIESNTSQTDVLDKILVTNAYNLLNRINYSQHRPRWEGFK